jgi:hypothetical protein
MGKNHLCGDAKSVGRLRHISNATAAGLLCYFLAAPGVSALEIVTAESKGPFVGTCMASAVVAYPAGTVDQFMIVGNDETNVLQTFRVTAGESNVLKTSDLNTFLKVDDGKKSGKVDIEAATWLGGEAVWIGSHSRNSDGELRPARGQLFSTDLVLEDGIPIAKPAQKIPEGSLLEAFSKITSMKDIIALDKKKDPSLAAKMDGFNIEGLSVADDGSSLVVGLRGPLTGNHAYLLTVNNALEAFKTESLSAGSVKVAKSVAFGEGKGIRSLEYSAARKAYFVIAAASGPDNDRPDFELHLWDGRSDQSTLIPGLRDKIEAAGIKKFQPEALAVDGAGTKLLILSDDENRCSNNSFRGVVVTLK